MRAEPLPDHLNLDGAEAEIAALPRWYAMRLNGDCMLPLLKTGDFVVFDTETWPRAGDIATIYLKGIKNGVPGIYPWVKRITMGMWPHRIRLPYRLIGESNVIPLLSFESNIPGQRWTVKATAIYAVHKFVGKQDDLVWDGNLWVPRPKGRVRRRKPVITSAPAPEAA